MNGNRFRRLLAPAVQLRQGESTTAALMFAYSFLAMTSYNILKPLTRSKFISNLGADNLPYVLLASGFVIGLLMHWYTTAAARIPRRHVIPVTQGAIIAPMPCKLHMRAEIGVPLFTPFTMTTWNGRVDRHSFP